MDAEMTDKLAAPSGKPCEVCDGSGWRDTTYKQFMDWLGDIGDDQDHQAHDYPIIEETDEWRQYLQLSDPICLSFATETAVFNQHFYRVVPAATKETCEVPSRTPTTKVVVVGENDERQSEKRARLPRASQRRTRPQPSRAAENRLVVTVPG